MPHIISRKCKARRRKPGAFFQMLEAAAKIGMRSGPFDSDESPNRMNEIRRTGCIPKVHPFLRKLYSGNRFRRFHAKRRWFHE